MSHKQDWPRPYNGRKFRDNYDEIFKKGKPTLVDEYHPDTVKLRDHGKHSKKRKP
jgi:hypothetical protein